MRNIFLIFTLWYLPTVVYAACSSPISRTNSSPNTVLTSTKYNTDVNTVYTHVNNIDGDCIQDASIETAKVLDANITRAKLAVGYKDYTLLSKTATYSAIATDEAILVDATSGAVTINLPAVTSISGRTIFIKKTDTTNNAVTIDGNGSENIDRQLTFALRFQDESVIMVADGAKWQSISFSKPVLDYHCRINNNGTATVDTGSGLCAQWVSSVSRTGVGTVSITLVSGAVPNTPVCLETPFGGSTQGAALTSVGTSTIIATTHNTAGGLSDLDFNISCWAKR